MSTESHFQRLPLHVAQLVVNHVVHGGSSDLFGGPKPSLKPLLWACRNFRAIVFAQVSGSFKLWLDRHRDQLKSEWRFTSLFYVQTGIPKYRFAKELCLWLDEQSVCSGKMLDMLLRESYDVGTFPMARSILLCFMPLPLPEDGIEVESIDIDSDEAEANLNAFVQHIKLMAPNVSNIKVWGSDNRRYQPFAPSSRFQTLSARLYMLTNSIGFVSTSENLKIDLPLSLIHDVAHINYSSSECNGQVFSLIRHCAPTLESLTLSARCFDDRLASLIRCDNGTHTTYPRLLTLSISSYSNADSSSEPTFENAVPFPSLQHLHINKYYSFGDDVLFRGNSAALRSLHLVLNPFAVDLLTRHKVFTSTSHPNLQIVKLKRISGLIAISFRASAHNYMRFALMIGPNAVVRDIGSRKTADDFRGIQPDTHLLRPALSLFAEHPWISVLALSDMRLELWDGLDIVKSLPQLTDLHTDGITFDEMPHGVTADELPDYVVATYGSASERFQCWHIIDYRTGGCDVLALCVLLLALACPSFSYIAHPYSSRIQVYEPMVNMSKSARFEPYMPRLERLFSKWKDQTQHH